MEPLLNYKQASEFLNIGKSTLYMLVSSGDLPAVRFGGKITRFRRRDLEEFVEARVSRCGQELGKNRQ